MELKHKIQVICLVLVTGWLGYEHLRLNSNYDLAYRELKGVRLEIQNGVYSKVNNDSSGLSKHTDTRYIPPEGKVVITPKDKTKRLNEVVDIRYQTFGYCFEPGFDLGLLRGVYLGPSYGLDAKVLFWNRLGVTGGIVGLESVDHISLAVGLSYRLDGKIRFIHNTELDFKYAPRYIAPLWIGLRWSL